MRQVDLDFCSLGRHLDISSVFLVGRFGLARDEVSIDAVQKCDNPANAVKALY
jgi:hypothetical protein